MKDIINDTAQQPDEEVRRARSRKVPSAGASVPVEPGVHHSDAFTTCLPFFVFF